VPRRLDARGAHLAAHLTNEVAQSFEVLLGCRETSLGALLAASVLQDTGRLLDDRATILRGGIKDGVELALADDHVLLTPDTGVAQELLDVEQATGGAIDGVFGVTVSKERSRDRDLGAVDPSFPEVLSSVSATSARPSAALCAVPAKMTSSILALRRARCSARPRPR